MMSLYASIIIAGLVVQPFIIWLLLRPIYGNIKIIRRRLAEITSELTAIASQAPKIDERSMIIEANRFRAEHPELWRWEPEASQAPVPINREAFLRPERGAVNEAQAGSPEEE
jgi:hypothetical protein